MVMTVSYNVGDSKAPTSRHFQQCAIIMASGFKLPFGSSSELETHRLGASDSYAGFLLSPNRLAGVRIF